MATCAQCKIQETQMYEKGVPVCLKCSDTSPSKPPATALSKDASAVLLQEVLRTTALCEEAATEFDKVVCQVPNRVPHPDGGKTIIDATRKMAIARNEMVMAHNRLNDYMEQLPHDLKRSACG